MQAEQLDVEAAKRDPEHFRVLYNRYYERIFLYVWQRIDDKEVSHDVTSQVFLKAMQNLYKYEFKGVPFASWLYRIAKSEVYSLLRKEQVQRAINMDSGGLKDIMDEMDEDPYAEWIPLLSGAVAELDEEDVQMVEMRFFEKRAFKEIADILGMTENNAKVKTYRILEKLKKILLNKKRSRA